MALIVKQFQSRPLTETLHRSRSMFFNSHQAEQGYMSFWQILIQTPPALLTIFFERLNISLMEMQIFCQFERG
jgi:hypothetical protein